ILLDVLGLEEQRSRESDVARTHEQMVVLDTDRPVLREPKFETSTDCAAPTGFVGRGEQRTGGPTEGLILVAGDGGTAFDVEQNLVPGVADLPFNQPKRIDLRTVEVGCKEETDVAAAEIGPVALTFHPEHPTGPLPAIADLTADRAASCVMAAFRPGEI